MAPIFPRETSRRKQNLGRRALLCVEGLEHRITPTTGLRVALISDEVDQFSAIAQAADAGVIVRVYDSGRTGTSGLLEILERASAEIGTVKMMRSSRENRDTFSVRRIACRGHVAGAAGHPVVTR